MSINLTHYAEINSDEEEKIFEWNENTVKHQSVIKSYGYPLFTKLCLLVVLSITLAAMGCKQ